MAKCFFHCFFLKEYECRNRSEGRTSVHHFCMGWFDHLVFFRVSFPRGLDWSVSHGGSRRQCFLCGCSKNPANLPIKKVCSHCWRGGRVAVQGCSSWHLTCLSIFQANTTSVVGPVTMIRWTNPAWPTIHSKDIKIQAFGNARTEVCKHSVRKPSKSTGDSVEGCELGQGNKNIFFCISIFCFCTCC